jgi:uncharacterized protein (DUF697 family)
MENGHLLRAATDLVRAMNHVADENLPDKLAGIVKLHAGLNVGSMLIPVPGADMAAAAASIWTMYVRINKELSLPFAENALRSIATGVVTNLAGNVAGFLVVGTALKLIPGLGSLGGAAVMAGTAYAITIAAGIVYMKAITKVLASNAHGRVTPEEVTGAAAEMAADPAMQEVLRAARKEYKRNN